MVRGPVRSKTASTRPRIASSASPPNQELMPNHPAPINARAIQAREGARRACRTTAAQKRDRGCRARPRVRNEQNRRHDHDASDENRQDRLPPVHAERDHPACERVGGKTQAHPNPERGELRTRPRMLGQCTRTQIVIPHRVIARKLRLFRRREHHDVAEAFLRERHYCATSES